MSPEFDRFVAIDWSGARGSRYRGIAVAQCGPGDEAPRLVPAPDGWWSRGAVLDWLRRDAPGRVLAGFDFAFSLPFAKAGRHFADPGAAGAFDLWDLVERACGDAPDFLGSPFVETAPFAADFWVRGPRPAGYVDARRETERVCMEEGLGHPQSPYHLIGSKQVGRGALAGMRVLRRLRHDLGRDVAIWPFEAETADRLVCVEIYPRLFLRLAGFGTRKVRDRAALDGCLARLGSRPTGTGGAPDDHQADALVSAAGLRRLAAEASAWRPCRLDERSRRRDGWIFGVGLGIGTGAIRRGDRTGPAAL
ncbi:hypothetical protein [Arenibaculum sp.]|jgi:hypothetical protein|uniref:hypothetical protein n=1 Tax=Arenibaculum sp. TaxID=2865862 RepID=UPI002E0E12A1|nr:hypothetical protein [Arenibaculum sp.]